MWNDTKCMAMAIAGAAIPAATAAPASARLRVACDAASWGNDIYYGT
jgi:hypothetical protein